jgi:hypothetical protein
MKAKEIRMSAIEHRRKRGPAMALLAWLLVSGCGDAAQPLPDAGPPPSGKCHDLTQQGTPVTPTGMAVALPATKAAAGGVVAAGVYVLVAVEYYNATDPSLIPAFRELRLQGTLRVSADVFETLTRMTVPSLGREEMSLSRERFSVEGTKLRLTELCPNPARSPDVAGFSAGGGELVLLSSDHDEGTIRLVYHRR